jgi:hypothetical protein
MGHTATAKCLECGEIFTVSHSGGFFFHLLRCDTCGEAKSIGLDGLGDLHPRHPKGLPASCSFSRMEHGEQVHKDASAEPISKDDFYHGIEAVAGNCRCGGKYTLDAPPRCPKCHSTRIEEGAIILFYD